jgi:hypothetical protein
MKFMMTFRTDEPVPAGQSACRQHIPEMAALHEKLRADGVLLTSEALLPSDRGARVAYHRGDLAVTDGPFAEAKEVVAGFCVVNVPSKADAVALAGRFLRIAGTGRCEILEVFEHNSANPGRQAGGV